VMYEDEEYDALDDDFANLEEIYYQLLNTYEELSDAYNKLRGQYSEIAIVSGFEGDGLFGDATVDHQAIVDKVKDNAGKAWLYEGIVWKD